MDSFKIIEEVDSQGYCVFELDVATKTLIRSVDTSSLVDGFHVDLKAQTDLFSKSQIISNLIENCMEKLWKKTAQDNKINIARVVEGSSAEKYRTHFDSHILTLVVPILVPETEIEFKGQLYLVPNLRSEPKNDFSNFVTKVKAFRYKGEANYHKVKKLPGYKTMDLQVGQAILFNGNRSLHGNIENNSTSKRVTFITHMVDPFPNGFGQKVRLLRKKLGLRK